MPVLRALALAWLIFRLRLPHAPAATLFPYTTLFRSGENLIDRDALALIEVGVIADDGFSRTLSHEFRVVALAGPHAVNRFLDRKSTRLNSSHRCISYAVFCLKKKNQLGRIGSFTERC